MITARAKHTPLNVCVFDLKHVKSVTAWSIRFDDKQAGKIVANWSDNPAGSVCTAMVAMWDGPLKDLPRMTGRAGGYGYCKLSAAIDDALRRAADGIPDLHGRGAETVRNWLESLGYVVDVVI